MAEIAEHVVALLGKGDFVDGVADVARLEQVVGVLLGVASVGEALHVTVQPLDQV